MSGGKYGYESSTFEPVITPAILGALLKTGTEAVAEAGKAVELQRLMKLEADKYKSALEQQKQKSREALDIYLKNLSAEIQRLEKELRARGISLPNNSGSVESRLKQLYDLLATNSAVKSSSQIRTYYANLKTIESVRDWYEKICAAANDIIVRENEYSEKAAALKRQAERLLSANTRDAAALKKIYEELNAIRPEAIVSQKEKESLKQEYLSELARAKALCKITHTLIPYPKYSPDPKVTVQAIVRLKEISSSQIELIERIKKDPCLTMTPEKRKKACEAVANKICAVLVAKGMKLRQVAVLNKSWVCYYYYKEALLKVSIADTGAITFEVVGNPDKKTGFTNTDKRRVLEAMRDFQKSFPELQEKLKKANVVLTLESSVEPCDEIVTYEKPDIMTAEERAANEAAVLQMLENAQRVRFVGGT